MSESPDPPSTNRGVVRPDDREGGGVDYLKLTVWCEAKEACRVLEEGVLDRYGWSVDPYTPVEEWNEKPANGRARRVYDGGCVSVVEYTEAVTMGDVFCAVEVKGAGCEHMGNEGVLVLLQDFETRFRARASRVDVMAHTEAFTPRIVRDAVHNGDCLSRAVTPDKMVYIESATGDTCYLGMQSKPNGGLKRCGDRVLRVYDRRGPSRVELQMCGGYGHGAGALLLGSGLEEWPGLIRGLMRHYCDFVDRTADERATRCPLLPWWEAFVGHVEKISVRSPTHSTEGTPLATLDWIFKTYVRRLWAAKQVYGADWIMDRIDKHASWLSPVEFGDAVAELQPYLGTGLAGVPSLEAEPPF